MEVNKNILIIGAGPHAEVVIDIIETENIFNIIGIIDSKKEIGYSLNGYEVIGRQEDIVAICKNFNTKSGIICIGDNWNRKIVSELILSLIPDFDFITTIHPKAIISSRCSIGKGSVIMPGVTININAKIGNFCIINTNSSFEHYCSLGNYSSISAGVTTGGFVNIGILSAIALGVTIFDRINIGDNTVVGSGSLVTKDLPSDVLAYGVPAVIIRKREIDEKFLK
jgi:sugar O-acyltransferase (sialic acid O-acetyltransferase NeuD family)